MAAARPFIFFGTVKQRYWRRKDRSLSRSAGNWVICERKAFWAFRRKNNAVLPMAIAVKNQSINQSKHISIAPYVASESEAHDDGN